MSEDITVPVFTPAVVPDITPDETPESTHELSCETCGKELTYSGRGRKPKFCDEHKKSSGGVSKRKSLGKNDQMAAQAAEALVQMNGIAAIGIMMFGLPLTATALKNAEDTFREQAYSALLTDPALCATILRGGTASGKVALLIAYGMLGAAVAPVGIMEFKEKREQARIMADASDSE